ncbi:MAG: hypothetical protein Q9M37_02570 [Desulfonauticus sp.]|nr:hypothetical protein [Desulfonauticus sp.]
MFLLSKSFQKDVKQILKQTTSLKNIIFNIDNSYNRKYYPTKRKIDKAKRIVHEGKSLYEFKKAAYEAKVKEFKLCLDELIFSIEKIISIEKNYIIQIQSEFNVPVAPKIRESYLLKILKIIDNTYTIRGKNIFCFYIQPWLTIDIITKFIEEIESYKALKQAKSYKEEVWVWVKKINSIINELELKKRDLKLLTKSVNKIISLVLSAKNKEMENIVRENFIKPLLTEHLFTKELKLTNASIKLIKQVENFNL